MVAYACKIVRSELNEDNCVAENNGILKISKRDTVIYGHMISTLEQFATMLTALLNKYVIHHI